MARRRRKSRRLTGTPASDQAKAARNVARHIRHRVLEGLPIRKVWVEPQTGRVHVHFAPRPGVRQSIIARFAAMQGLRYETTHGPDSLSGFMAPIPRAGALTWAEKAEWAMRPFG